AITGSCRLLLRLLAPLPFRREAVHVRAMVEGGLRGAGVGRRAAPRVERDRLQRAAVAEGERPGCAPGAVHRVEVRRRVLVGLSAGKEYDAGERGRNRAL